MRIRPILTAVTLTTAILIGGTGTAAAQSQPLPNGACLLDNVVDSLLPGIGVSVIIINPEDADPCDTIADNGQVL